MQISVAAIHPSQDFLKEKTIRFIFQCLHSGETDKLPPPPLIREDQAGNLVAIDGHNLLAVRAFRQEPAEVVVVQSAADGLPDISVANRARNEELRQKFDSCLMERRRIKQEGINSFADLIGRYPELFRAE